MTKFKKQNLVTKLMVIGLNQAIASGRIDLNGHSGPYTENRSPEVMEMTIGDRPALLSWFDAGYDELRVTVWWDWRPDMMPTWRKKHLHRSAGYSVPSVARRFYPLILGACGSCYLERREGKYIAGFFDLYVREETASQIDAIRFEPANGYELRGE